MSQYTILFVDDEPKILSSLRRLFIDSPYNVLTAEGGKNGLDLIEGGETPAVVVSDQRMPEMNGAEFLTMVRKLLPDSVRMLLTGYSDINAAMDAINEGGIHRYITKPWNDDDLQLAIQGALEHFELVEQNRQLTAELQEKNHSLEDLNANLEQKVEARTRALRVEYEKNLGLTHDLQIKVKELEGRDRIQQHLLTIHTLEETLQVVLEVIVEVLSVDAAVIHLASDDGELVPAAAIGTADGEGQTPAHRLKELSNRSIHKTVITRCLEKGEPVHIDAKTVKQGDETFEIAPFAVVPIVKAEKRLGAIEVDRRGNRSVISADEVKTIQSFAMQAAVAISDSKMQDNLPDLEANLDDVLRDLQA